MASSRVVISIALIVLVGVKPGEAVTKCLAPVPWSKLPDPDAYVGELVRDSPNCEIFCLAANYAAGSYARGDENGPGGCECRCGDETSTFRPWREIARRVLTPTERCDVLCKRREAPVAVQDRHGAYYCEGESAKCACLDAGASEPLAGMDRIAMSNADAMHELNADMDGWQELSPAAEEAAKEMVCREVKCRGLAGYWHSGSCSCYGPSTEMVDYRPERVALQVQKGFVSVESDGGELLKGHSNCHIFCAAMPEYWTGHFTDSIGAPEGAGCMCQHGGSSLTPQLFSWPCLAREQLSPTQECTVLCHEQHDCPQVLFGGFHQPSDHGREGEPTGPTCYCYDEKTYNKRGRPPEAAHGHMECGAACAHKDPTMVGIRHDDKDCRCYAMESKMLSVAYRSVSSQLVSVGPYVKFDDFVLVMRADGEEIKLSTGNCELLCAARPGFQTGTHSSDCERPAGCVCATPSNNGRTALVEWPPCVTQLTATEECTVICQKGELGAAAGVVYGGFHQSIVRGLLAEPLCHCYGAEAPWRRGERAPSEESASQSSELSTSSSTLVGDGHRVRHDKHCARACGPWRVAVFLNHQHPDDGDAWSCRCYRKQPTDLTLPYHSVSSKLATTNTRNYIVHKEFLATLHAAGSQLKETDGNCRLFCLSMPGCVSGHATHHDEKGCQCERRRHDAAPPKSFFAWHSVQSKAQFTPTEDCSIQCHEEKVGWPIPGVDVVGGYWQAIRDGALYDAECYCFAEGSAWIAPRDIDAVDSAAVPSELNLPAERKTLVERDMRCGAACEFYYVGILMHDGHTCRCYMLFGYLFTFKYVATVSRQEMCPMNGDI